MSPAITKPEGGPNPLQPTPSLSLPPAQFARLQPHSYLLAHLSPSPESSRPSLRVNGRTKSQFRPASVNTGSLTHTNGSAVVRIGDTAAVCGVRAEILSTDDIAAWNVSSSGLNKSKRRKTEGRERSSDESPINKEDDSEIQSFNLLVPNLSLGTGCSPSFAPGAPPSSLAQSLSHELLALLHSTHLIDPEDLRIWFQPPSLGDENEDVDMESDGEAGSGKQEPEIKAFWTLYIDVLIISLAGNPFDAAWAAMLAALRDTRLPKAWWDLESEMILCSDDVSESRILNLRGLPVSSSFCVFEADAAAEWRAVEPPEPTTKRKGKKRDGDAEESQERWILADPDTFEESLCPERVCLVVDRDQTGKVKILKLEKNGGLTVGRYEMREFVDLAADRWKEFKDVLESAS